MNRHVVCVQNPMNKTVCMPRSNQLGSIPNNKRKKRRIRRGRGVIQEEREMVLDSIISQLPNPCPLIPKVEEFKGAKADKGRGGPKNQPCWFQCPPFDHLFRFGHAQDTGGRDPDLERIFRSDQFSDRRSQSEFPISIPGKRGGSRAFYLDL